VGIKFTGIKKGADGSITHIRTNQGNVLSITEAQSMARSGQIDSLTDVHADGTWEIASSTGEGQPRVESNLDTLPEFQ
jgi:hypothetical protein